MERGLIIYQGPSVLDGSPIVALASYMSANIKTGFMVQTWIMRDDVTPAEAEQTGKDESVCGQCPSRHFLGGGCYVSMRRGPQAVWRSYKNGGYVEATPERLLRLSGRAVRLGAYGDPAAVPYSAWEPLLKVASMTTGYTHQSLHPNFDERMLDYCMVSADTEEAVSASALLGRRTFRVKTVDEPVLKGEIVCPATVRMNYQCVTCGICNGANRSGANVVVNAHGVLSKRYSLIKVANE